MFVATHDTIDATAADLDLSAPGAGVLAGLDRYAILFAIVTPFSSPVMRHKLRVQLYAPVTEDGRVNLALVNIRTVPGYHAGGWYEIEADRPRLAAAILAKTIGRIVLGDADFFRTNLIG